MNTQREGEKRETVRSKSDVDSPPEESSNINVWRRPLPPYHHASLLSPRVSTAFWIRQYVLSEGDWGEESGQPHLSKHTWELGTRNAWNNISSLNGRYQWYGIIL